VTTVTSNKARKFGTTSSLSSWHWVRWIRAAIAPLGPLAGPLSALLLPQTANPYPMYRAVVAKHAIL
jgi:hypothetical protein